MAGCAAGSREQADVADKPTSLLPTATDQGDAELLFQSGKGHSRRSGLLAHTHLPRFHTDLIIFSLLSVRYEAGRLCSYD